MSSIRNSLIIGTVAVTVCAWSIASVAIYRGARNTLVDHLDEELEEDARLIASTVRSTGNSVELEFQNYDLSEFTSATGPGYVQLWAEDGSVLYRSPGLNGGDLRAAGVIDSDKPVSMWTQSPAGMRVRAIGILFTPLADNTPNDGMQAVPLPGGGTHRVRLIAAIEPTETEAFLARLKVLLVAVGVFTGLAAIVMLAVVIRSRLRPLGELAERIESLGDADLSSRVSLRSTPREIEPIVGQLNRLLSRLENAFERERTFSADIAHELRTPMAGLRASVEVSLSRPREADDYRETLENTLEPIHRVQTMVEKLLYLGRLEAGQIEIVEQTVDVRELVASSWRPLDAIARERRLHVAWDQPRAVNVVTDPMLLEVAIRNILENATLYADEGGYLRVRIAEENGSRTLSVVNSGSKVAANDVGSLLERFTRGDVSRRSSGDHFGLGLALAEKIASALRCSMRVESRLGGEFSVTVSLRAAPSAN
ncbi:MAG TPA: histidine kinase dimerization/phospho-acceptor domain-containing protein [Candidatus Krumholzibacteria bacterium]|nr:histidine kinase dimerization/phospho-acceptor domain-containing protein [Candidatus Krumholzibacteria bacterium]